jgi:N-acetylneuraminate synthase
MVMIGNREISDRSPTFLIGEIGINHNGDIEIAKSLIEEAVKAGFDAVKFQKRTVESVYSADELDLPRQSAFGNTNRDLKKGLEFNFDQYLEISNYCKARNIFWFASPWDVDSVDFLEQLNVIAYKVASASITNSKLLSKIASTGKPVFMSTGMSTLEQVKQAVAHFSENNLILMHTVSVYPAKPELLNLNWITQLRSTFPNIPIGYSGHEVGLIASIVAVAKFNSVCVERHITLDRAMWGTDQAASVEPKGMRDLVKNIRMIPIVVGEKPKYVLEEELEIQKKLRKVTDF